MQKLNLPDYDFQHRFEEGKLFILDPFRKKYVLKTPEEEVRQRFANYLVEEKGYPRSLIRTEYTLNLNRMVRRCDILVDKPAGSPVVLVECKAPKVKISQDTFDQAARYNMVFQVPYLMVTNGLKHFCVQLDFATRKVDFMESIPSYKDLKSSTIP